MKIQTCPNCHSTSIPCDCRRCDGGQLCQTPQKCLMAQRCIGSIEMLRKAIDEHRVSIVDIPRSPATSQRRLSDVVKEMACGYCNKVGQLRAVHCEMNQGALKVLVKCDSCRGADVTKVEEPL